MSHNIATADPERIAPEITVGRLPAAEVPMSILFSVFQTGRMANGGVESVTAIIKDLKECERIVVTNLESPFCERWRKAGARVIVWDLGYEIGASFAGATLREKLARIVGLVKTNLDVFRWLRSQSISLIHCNDPAPFWHVALAARAARIPLLLNLRDTKTPAEGLNAGKYRRRFRWSTRVLVLSKEMKRFYERVFAGMPIRKSPQIVYGYSAVDLSRFHPVEAPVRRELRSRLRIEPGQFALGFIATFNDKKNQLGFLRSAIPLLAQRCPQAHTYFVGDFDPQRDAYALECERLTEQLQLKPYVTFQNYTAQIQDWYRACDVIVVPTRKEGLARCMIEALACGTPVVSFDVASAHEILSEHGCGRVVSQGDYVGFCSNLIELAESSELRNEYGTQGAALARRCFSNETCLNTYRALTHELVTRR